ncbi:hypothetical protein [Streptomyces sp. NPDC097619]|uniref:hypothetical protein n=1 Tax=Streptomyces sp. NPDC097619 TaxID=3157228 RepID=UPI003333E444
MSTAAFTPVQGGRTRGATASSHTTPHPTSPHPSHDTHDSRPAAHGAGTPRSATRSRAAAGGRDRHRLGGALRAAKVFTAAAFSVAILGEYGEEAGIRRH